MSPPEELRFAAKLLRERADAATPGPWQHMCLGSEGCLVLRATGTLRERGPHGRVARFGQKEWQADHADAEYVATMHPGVARALADWLDRTVTDDEYGEVTGFDEALAVARACLGTDGSEEGQR
jgi:hypothetical protein